MSEKVFDIVVIAIGLPVAAVGFYLWFIAARHFVGSLIHFNWKRWWGLFIPVCMFIPYFFTEKGNYHRERFLWYAALFLAFCLTPIVIYELAIK
jgi:hypothetical protein